MTLLWFLDKESVESVEGCQLVCRYSLSLPTWSLNHVAPKQWVTVHRYIVLLAPLDDWLTWWSAPMRLRIRVFAVVPPLFAISLLGEKALVTLLQLGCAPI